VLGPSKRLGSMLLDGSSVDICQAPFCVFDLETNVLLCYSLFFCNEILLCYSFNVNFIIPSGF
jgi:hypothetical protein